MKIELELREPLTDQELQRLALLIRDAFGEFQTHRGVRNRGEDIDWQGAKDYVLTHCKGPPLMSENWIAEKTKQVVERCRQAQKLHDAEVSVVTDSTDP